MGVSTNGQICYGIPFEEGFEFPWGDDELDEWWLAVNGYKPSKQCWDENGRAPGITQADIDAHFQEKREFAQKCPCPVTLVNYCSGDYPMYILAVPSSEKSNCRGDTTEFDPSSLNVTPEEHAELLNFLKQHGIETDENPRWMLTSYWG